MAEPISRRRLLEACVAGAVQPSESAADRLGVMCLCEPEESAARRVLAAAREAGFRRAQIQFAWDRAGSPFLRELPGWVAAEGLRVEVLSAYVNCAAPERVIMGARAVDFDRALEFSPEIGARRLVAWTGGYGADLMKSDPRNFKPEASDAILRFLEPRLAKMEARRLTLALETYITLVCPDARALRSLLDRLPPFITAVLDPPNLTPIARYGARDAVLNEMVRRLETRIGVVHLKDFRLAKDGRSYELPGPLAGEMNYRLFVDHVKKLPPDIPIVAEHLQPGEFAAARGKLLPLLA